MQRAAQCFDAVTGLPVGSGGKGFDNFFHCMPWQYARNVVSHGGHDFAPARGGEVGENKIYNSSSNVCESITVEEKERRAAMALPEEFYRFAEGADFGLRLTPFCFSRCIAL